MYVEKTKYKYLSNYQHPSSFSDVHFTKKEKRHNKSSLLCVLKTKNVHLFVHLCARGEHSLPLNSLLGHISHALSVATGRIPSLFCATSELS